MTVWLEIPVVWILISILVALLLVLKSELEERRVKQWEAENPPPPVIPIEGNHRHDR
jgi:hypothetical protein